MCATLTMVVKPPIHTFEAEFIHGSGINPELYASAVRVVGDLESDASGEAETPIHEALNWHYRRFGLLANQSLLAALLLNEDRTCWQAKLSMPKLEKQSGKRRKYETPVGNGSRAFLPAIPSQIWEAIANQYGVSHKADSFWGLGCRSS
jgi:hypothetical protein